MKRLVSMFAMAGMLLAAPAAMAGIDGDCNGDGIVGADDRSAVMAAINSTDDGSVLFESCDLDGDGVISLVDASKVNEILNAQ